MKSIFPCKINWLQIIQVEKSGNSGILKTAGDLWQDSCTLGAACDMVLAADDAVFGLPEIDTGIFSMGSPPVLLCTVGLSKWLELFSRGNRSSAKKQTCDSCA